MFLVSEYDIRLLSCVKINAVPLQFTYCAIGAAYKNTRLSKKVNQMNKNKLN